MLYQSFREKELNAADQLDVFEQIYPEIITADNVNDIIEMLQKKSQENRDA